MRKAITVTGARGEVTYTKVSKGSSKKLSIKISTDKITVKKGTAKGTYKLKVKVTAAGDENHNTAEKTVTAKIKVK